MVETCHRKSGNVVIVQSAVELNKKLEIIDVKFIKHSIYDNRENFQWLCLYFKKLPGRRQHREYTIL